MTGGLVARGEGTNDDCDREKGMEDGGASDKGEFAATGCEEGKPKFGGESVPPAGGLVADGVAAMGGAPELNSAHRGHFRFVSKHEGKYQNKVRGEMNQVNDDILM